MQRFGLQLGCCRRPADRVLTHCCKRLVVSWRTSSCLPPVIIGAVGGITRRGAIQPKTGFPAHASRRMPLRKGGEDVELSSPELWTFT